MRHISKHEDIDIHRGGGEWGRWTTPLVKVHVWHWKVSPKPHHYSFLWTGHIYPSKGYIEMFKKKLRPLVILWSRGSSIPGELDQCHQCWSPGCLRQQAITSLSIKITEQVKSCRPWGRLSTTNVPAWVSNYIPRKVFDEITYPFPNFNGCTLEV